MGINQNLRYLGVLGILTFALTAFASEGRTSGGETDPPSSEVGSEVIPNVAVPKDLETCFSPGGQCDGKILAFMKSAKRSLDIAIYNLTLRDIATAIKTAAQNGIKVRVVVDRLEAAGRSSLVKELASQGIPVRIGAVSGIMHNKYTIVDDSAVETGSYNYTASATNANAENQIYLYASQVVSRYSEEFNKLWDAAKPMSSLADDTGVSH